MACETPMPKKKQLENIRSTLNSAHEAKKYASQQLHSSKNKADREKWKQVLEEEKEAFDEIFSRYNQAKDELNEEYEALNAIKRKLDSEYQSKSWAIRDHKSYDNHFHNYCKLERQYRAGHQSTIANYKRLRESASERISEIKTRIASLNAEKHSILKRIHGWMRAATVRISDRVQADAVHGTHPNRRRVENHFRATARNLRGAARDTYSDYKFPFIVNSYGSKATYE